MDGNESYIRNDDRNIKKGDLVRWFELYNEGIVKDAGLGSILSLELIPAGFGEVYVRYNVWRFQKNDIIWCSPNEIEAMEKLGGHTNEEDKVPAAPSKG